MWRISRRSCWDARLAARRGAGVQRVAPEELGGREQPTAPRPGESHLALGPGVGERHQPDQVTAPRTAHQLLVLHRRHDRDAQAGRDEAADDGEVVALEGDRRLEPRGGAQLVAQGAQLPLAAQHHERLVGGLGERDTLPLRQRVADGHGEEERLGEQALPGHVRVAGAAGGELQVDAASCHERRPELVARGFEPELHAGMLRAELRDRARDQPGAQRQLEGDDHRAGLRVGELVHGRQRVVQAVQDGVELALEDHAGVGGAQHPTAPVQQRSPDLLLQPGQRPGDPGLAHAVDVGDLGHRDPVDHLLEPAQRLRLHTHDDSAWFYAHIYIGRMDRGSGDLLS